MRDFCPDCKNETMVYGMNVDYCDFCGYSELAETLRRKVADDRITPDQETISINERFGLGKENKRGSAQKGKTTV